MSLLSAAEGEYQKNAREAEQARDGAPCGLGETEAQLGELSWRFSMS
jgi:hypothetical protein